MLSSTTANAVDSTKEEIKENPNVGVPTVKDENTEQAGFQSKLQFKVEEADHTDKCVESPEIQLQNVLWKVKTCKENKDNVDILNIFLVSTFSADKSKWSCDAAADFVLKKIENGPEDITKQLETKTFTSTNSENGAINVTDWENFKKFLVDGVATFEITLKISPPNRVETFEQISTVFHFYVPNVYSNDTYSNQVKLRGVRWYIRAMKSKNNDGDILSLYLYGNGNDMEFNYQWNVNAKLTLLSTKKGVNAVTKTIDNFKLHWRTQGAGHPNFIDFKTLTDTNNEYVFNNGAIFKIELNVDAPTDLQ